MTNAYWQWIFEFETEALKTRDPDHLRVAQIRSEAYESRETDPDRTVNLYREGRQLAAKLGLSWWGLYYDHMRVHALLHCKRDYKTVLELAVANTLEAASRSTRGCRSAWASSRTSSAPTWASTRPATSSRSARRSPTSRRSSLPRSSRAGTRSKR